MQKLAGFINVSLNASELLLPAPFSRIGLCLYSSFHDRSPTVCRDEIMCFKPYQFKFKLNKKWKSLNAFE